MKVSRLRLLRELESRGTIAAVAEALSFSPSAVSQQLAQLERETGAQLLERVGRGVRLTPVARSVLDRVDRILDELNEVEATLARGSGEPSGTVKLSTFQSAGIELVPPAMSALRRDAPGLRVEVVEAEPERSLPALAAGDVDLVLAEDYVANRRERDPRLDRVELCRDAILIALPSNHPAARAGGAVHMAELAGDPWAFTRAGTVYAQMAVRACKDIGGFVPDVRHRANDFMVILALVAAGHAVAFVPELIGRGWPGIAFRPLADRPLDRTIFTAARVSASDHPAIVKVRAALAREARVRLARPGAADYPAWAAASSGPAPAASKRSASSRPAAEGSAGSASRRSRIQADPSGSPT